MRENNWKEPFGERERHAHFGGKMQKVTELRERETESAGTPKTNDFKVLSFPSGTTRQETFVKNRQMTCSKTGSQIERYLPSRS